MMTVEDQIKRHESLRLQVYDDATGNPIVPGSHVVGHPTIGYGRCLDRTGISQREADMLFGADMRRAMLGLDSKLPWWRGLDAMRRDALVEMTYNLGINGLLTFRRMLTALKDQRYGEAAVEALDSRWAQQVGRRARVIADMLRYG